MKGASTGAAARPAYAPARGLSTVAQDRIGIQPLAPSSVCRGIGTFVLPPGLCKVPGVGSGLESQPRPAAQLGRRSLRAVGALLRALLRG